MKRSENSPGTASEERAEDPIAIAREYGVDISLLRSNLLRTPEERLRIAGALAEFAKKIRGQARHG